MYLVKYSLSGGIFAWIVLEKKNTTFWLSSLTYVQTHTQSRRMKICCAGNSNPSLLTFPTHLQPLIVVRQILIPLLYFRRSPFHKPAGKTQIKLTHRSVQSYLHTYLFNTRQGFLFWDFLICLYIWLLLNNASCLHDNRCTK